MSTSALPDSRPPALPSAEGLFDHWLQARASDPWSPLTAQAAKPYRFIWGAWSKFLLPPSLRLLGGPGVYPGKKI